MAGSLSLSILDFQHPGGSVALACAADEWGYTRYWLGEHHSASQTTNPILLGALLAGTTQRIRLGTGGISLPYHNALRVAEDARLIEFMMPGRFDLGVTRGLVSAGPVADALLAGGGGPAGATPYEEKVCLLHGLVTGRLDPAHPLAGVRPYLEGGPPLWLLGLSRASAELAGKLGLGFCFSVHHSGPDIDGPAVMAHYRASFTPSPEFSEPASIVVVRCVCAATEAEAKAVEAALVVPPVPSDQLILGSPGQCAGRIAQTAADFSTGEVMLIDFIQKDQDARLEMYRLLAREFGLPVPP